MKAIMNLLKGTIGMAPEEAAAMERLAATIQKDAQKPSRVFYAGEEAQRRMGPKFNMKGDPQSWAAMPNESSTGLQGNFTQSYSKSTGPNPKVTTVESQRAQQEALRGRSGEDSALAKSLRFAKERPLLTAAGLGGAGIGIGAMTSGGGEEELDPAVRMMLERRYGGV
jgi:hypothetical protein